MRKKDITTEVVAALPTPTAPPPALNPSWDATVMTTTAKTTDFTKPISRSLNTINLNVWYKNIPEGMPTIKTPTMNAPAIERKKLMINREGRDMIPASSLGLTR